MDRQEDLPQPAAAPRHSRRQFLLLGAAGGLAVLSASLLAACGGDDEDDPTDAPTSASGDGGGDAQQGGTLVYATWGGSWEEAMRQAWFDPFTAQTGIEIVTAQDPAYGRIQAMVDAGNTEWDVAEVNPDFPIIGEQQDLLEPIDFSQIGDPSDALAPEVITPYSVPQVSWAMVITYNTNEFADEHPTSWAEVWDLERFPGKRAFGTGASGGILEAALLADGVAPEQIYPVDVERALASLDTIRDDIIWYETGAQQVQYWTDEQAAVGLGWDGRVLVAADEGAPVAIEYNESFLTWSSMVIPKGAPHKELAMQFLAYTFTPEAQAAVAEAMPYGPLNSAAFALLPPERANVVSGGPQMEGKYIVRDEAWWAENLESVQEQFNAWRLGG